MVFLIILLSVWKIIDLIISFIAPKIIPYLGFFSYANTMFKYGLPDFIRKLSNFDGIFYIRIALKGYSQYEQAYFPLYPLLIRFITPLTGNNPIIAGVLISHLAFFLAFFVLYRCLKLERIPHKHIWWTLCFLLFYPTSFFFGVMYTESLFLLLFTSTLFFLKRKAYILAFVFGYFTALTRVTGIFLLIPIIAFFVIEVKRMKQWVIKEIYLLAAPVLGLLTYCWYLWKTTGDPIYFFHAQEYFGAHRSTNFVFIPQVIYRYIKIFLTAKMNFQYFVAAVELLFFVSVACILLLDLRQMIKKKKFNAFRLGLYLFSWVNLLVPTLTGTLTAIPRYSMMSLSIFLFLGEMKNARIKTAVLIFFILFHILLFGLFIQGYYVT